MARRPWPPARRSTRRPPPSSRASRAARCRPGSRRSYLPKKTRGQSVNATLTLHYGTLDGVTGKAATADMTVDMLMRGTRNLSRQQIKDRLDSLKAKLSISGGPTQLNASIETTRPNLPAVLQLLGSVLREPAFDAKEFEAAPAGKPRGARAAAVGPDRAWLAGLQPHHQPLAEGTSALHANLRRIGGRLHRGQAGRRAGLLCPVPRRRAAASWRSWATSIHRRGQYAARRVDRQLEEPDARTCACRSRCST